MVLIIDDEQIILDTLRVLFEREGIITATESDPRKAVERYQQGDFNVVLVDIVMPEMKGEEVIRAIKQVNPLCNIIVMTAYSSMQHVIDCIEAGAFDYVTKPLLDTDLLIKIVRQGLERARRWRQSFGVFPLTAKQVSE
jgi:DNA-binding NtrC family response regulator